LFGSFFTVSLFIDIYHSWGIICIMSFSFVHSSLYLFDYKTVESFSSKSNVYTSTETILVNFPMSEAYIFFFFLHVSLFFVETWTFKILDLLILEIRFLCHLEIFCCCFLCF
jgi:hypothetical protein